MRGVLVPPLDCVPVRGGNRRRLAVHRPFSPRLSPALSVRFCNVITRYFVSLSLKKFEERNANGFIIMSRSILFYVQMTSVLLVNAPFRCMMIIYYY